MTFSQDKNGNYIIVGVAKDSPAEKAGLKSGDYIVEANGFGQKRDRNVLFLFWTHSE